MLAKTDRCVNWTPQLAQKEFNRLDNNKNLTHSKKLMNIFKN